jgi:hypothetical protein
MIRQRGISLFAVLASAMAVGCSGAESAPSSEPEQIASALERENGGLARTNEAPGFGDPDADAVPMSDESADEDRTLGEALAGSSACRGAIGVSKTIRFDAGDRLEQRASVSEVRFVSHTAPHVDGLLVSVRVPEGASPIVRFRTAILNADLDLAGAIDGGAIRAPDGVNGLVYMSYEDRPGCASGFLVGRWRALRDDLGVFHGRVSGDHGAPLGHVRGIWGHAPRADKNVFFGKYINHDGEFRGLFGGVYGDGHLRGIWGAREPAAAGVIAGRYGEGRVSDDGKGVFLGRFTERCSQ